MADDIDSDIIDTAPARRFKGHRPRYEVWVYFIGPEGGPIKIGYAQQPQKRFRVLQLENAYPLKMWAMVEGTQTLEGIYHARFAHRKLHGEWFERCPEIEAEIAKLNKSTRNTVWSFGDAEGRPAYIQTQTIAQSGVGG